MYVFDLFDYTIIYIGALHTVYFPPPYRAAPSILSSTHTHTHTPPPSLYTATRVRQVVKHSPFGMFPQVRRVFRLTQPWSKGQSIRCRI